MLSDTLKTLKSSFLFGESSRTQGKRENQGTEHGISWPFFWSGSIAPPFFFYTEPGPLNG
jgi:hypothetical protein